MKRALLLTVAVVSSVPFLTAADDGALVLGSVEAVYHEGVVTFTVEHPEAVSASIRVYDLATDGVIYDSGPRARTRVTWPAGHDLGGSYRYLVTAWNAEGEVVVSQTAANKTQTPISEMSFDTIPDNARVVGPGEIDLLGDVNIGTVPGVGLYRDYGGLGYGGGVVVYGDSTFDKRVYMSADAVTGAGYFRLNSPVGGLWIDGAQHLHGNETALSFYGGTSEFQFYAGETGTGSVVMPADAVSATEIENETGVAAVFASSQLSLPPTIVFSVLTRTITAPTDGFVFAISFVRGSLHHTTGEYTNYGCSISTLQGTHDWGSLASASLAPNAPSGTYQFPISNSRVIPVSAGDNQIHAVCQSGSTGEVNVFARHLDLLFVPTSYGTVSTESAESNIGAPGEPLTQTDAEAEKAESIAFNLARIQAELDAIQAQADALAAEVDQ